MTLIWFFIWFIWNLIRDDEPLTIDPVNWWMGSLLFVYRGRYRKTHVSTALSASRRRKVRRRSRAFESGRAVAR